MRHYAARTGGDSFGPGPVSFGPGPGVISPARAGSDFSGTGREDKIRARPEAENIRGDAGAGNKWTPEKMGQHRGI
jgi:hypothetical protein